jgi:hypothetical protein
MLGSRLRISTIEELDRWLDENCWFEDGYVLSLWPKPSPSGNQPHSRATLQLAYQVSGGWEAGDTRILRVFGVEAIGVREWSINTPDSYLPDHCMEGIDRIETGEGLGLIFDVPGPVSLICSELVIERQPDRTEPIKPKPSDREFSAIVPSRTRPSPTDWIEWLRRMGLEAVWRRYGGEAEPASQVPDDYTGWLLQTPKRIGESQAGLLFFHCGPNQNGDLVIHIQSYYDNNCQGLWAACGRVLGSMSGSVVRCGNCRLTGKQWLEYLDRGGTAYLDHLFLGPVDHSS